MEFLIFSLRVSCYLIVYEVVKQLNYRFCGPFTFCDINVAAVLNSANIHVLHFLSSAICTHEAADEASFGVCR